MKVGACSSVSLRWRLAQGFTLIELMITVAIVAILAAVAYPSYLDSVLKGRRAEGRTAILNLLQQQERYYTQTGSYMAFTAGATGDNGTNFTGTGVRIPFKTRSGETSSAYLLSAAACAGTALNECVLLAAVPVKPDVAAGTLTVSSSGAKSCDGSKQSLCWQ